MNLGILFVTFGQADDVMNVKTCTSTNGQCEGQCSETSVDLSPYSGAGCDDYVETLRITYTWFEEYCACTTVNNGFDMMISCGTCDDSNDGGDGGDDVQADDVMNVKSCSSTNGQCEGQCSEASLDLPAYSGTGCDDYV